MKILFDITPTQKKKILAILKLGDVTETVDLTTEESSLLKVAEGTEPDVIEPDVTEPDVTEPQPVTRQEVAEAVLARAKLTNSSDAISILKRVGGCPQLSEISADHYEAVLVALQAEPTEE